MAIRKYHQVSTNPDYTFQAKNKAAEATKESVRELNEVRERPRSSEIREEYRPRVEASGTRPRNNFST